MVNPAMFQKVVTEIQDFLNSKCHTAINKSIQHGIENPIKETKNGNGIGSCLLRIACLGNAERTLQGELFAHLKSKGFEAISECGYKDKLSIDIAILDNQGVPSIFVELKHYSANQGTTNKLIKGMNHDWRKLNNLQNKIIIGVFTSIDSQVNASSLPVDFYRFLSVYGPSSTKKRFDKAVKAQIIHNVNHQSFNLPGKKEITGRISYVMAWSNSDVPQYSPQKFGANDKILTEITNESGNAIPDHHDDKSL